MILSGKKIVYLITSLTFGGAQTQLCRLALSFRQRGWEVKVVSLCVPEAFDKELNDNGISVYSLGMIKGRVNLGSFFRFLQILKKEKPDVLHSHMVHANLLARISRLFVSIPVVICTVHSIYEGGWYRNWWYRLTDFLCDITTQVSLAGLQRFFREKLGLPKKAMFIANGVDVDFFKKDSVKRKKAREYLGVNDSFVWLSVGRFTEAKDYPNMIRAFNRICTSKNDSVLLIVGEGGLRTETELLIKKFGIKDKIKFLGIRKDIPYLMSGSDAYVMSSAWEGMPMVLLEAASCELPVVATDVGGNKDVVQEGKTGFLVFPKDPNRLAEAMGRLMDLSLEDRLCMGKEGRKYIEKEYSLERIVYVWECLYTKLLTSK